MTHATFQLDPITQAVKTAMEAGYSREVILGAINIDEETLKKHLNYLYARVFDSTNQHWAQSMHHNRTFLRVQENWMNDRLQARGYLFLNDVYDSLGMERSSQGALVGWYWQEGSNVVDIEIVDDAENGGLILQFNPDGIIYNKLSTF
jgi:hypothetical protein